MPLPFRAYHDNQFAKPHEPYRGRAVYFLLCSEEFVKIGQSEKNVKARIQGLIYGIPYPCRVVLLVVGKGLVYERSLHRRFAHLRVRGEWFRYEGELKEFIDQNRGLAPDLL